MSGLYIDRGFTRCGNVRHPDGPWHAAAPLPPSWNLRERWRQRARRRVYGCTCPARPRPPWS